jgi:two-component system, NarL family, nitrate/nitrite response regulator NarL
MTIRLVIADDHPIVLDGLEQLLSLEKDCEVVARARNGDEALQAVRQFQPDVLVLDLRMPGTDGLAVLDEMRREALLTRVVILSAMNSDDLFEAIRLGARGVVLKDMAPRLLMQCVRTVHAGGKWLEKGVATSAVDKLLECEAGIKAIAETLTPRELQVARMIAKGVPSKTVASRLAISEGTAKLHLHHVYEKLKVEGRVGLMRFMHSRGLD